MVALCEEAADHIMPYCNDEVKMTLEEPSGGWMVNPPVLSYLEEELKNNKLLFWAGNYSNNLFDLKKYLEHFHGL